MSPTPEHLHRLRKIATRSETEEDREWIAKAIGRYLLAADDGLTLEDAFELRASPGCQSWWRTEAILMRDIWLRGLAGFFPQESLYATAEAVGAALDRYATTRWVSEQFLPGPPRSSWNTPDQCMWYILEWNGGLLLSRRQLRRILAK